MCIRDREIQVSGDAQNVCAITIVGTVLKTSFLVAQTKRQLYTGYLAFVFKKTETDRTGRGISF